MSNRLVGIQRHAAVSIIVNGTNSKPRNITGTTLGKLHEATTNNTCPAPCSKIEGVLLTFALPALSGFEVA